MNIRQKLGLAPATGAIGLEIELEGNGFPTVAGWTKEYDGSLNEGGVEYVLNKPLSLSSSRDSLDHLSLCMRQYGTVVVPSARTSVHVHINVQLLTVKEMYSFITAYLILEGVLTRYCGKEREGNLFCLRSTDAEYLISVLVESVRSGCLGRLDDDNHRYSALNLCSLFRFGSLEFRAMRGDVDFDTIHNWAAMLLLLRNNSKKFEDPQGLVSDFSRNGGDNLLRSLVGRRSNLLIPLCPDIDELLIEGMRNAQDVAYAIPSWENF